MMLVAFLLIAQMILPLGAPISKALAGFTLSRTVASVPGCGMELSMQSYVLDRTEQVWAFSVRSRLSLVYVDTNLDGTTNVIYAAGRNGLIRYVWHGTTLTPQDAFNICQAVRDAAKP